MYTSPLWVILTEVLTETADQVAAGATLIVAVVIEKCTGQLAVIVEKSVKFLLSQTAVSLFFAATVLKKTAGKPEDQTTGITPRPEDPASKDQILTKTAITAVLRTSTGLKTMIARLKITINSLPLTLNSTASSPF